MIEVQRYAVIDAQSRILEPRLHTWRWRCTQCDSHSLATFLNAEKALEYGVKHIYQCHARTSVDPGDNPSLRGGLPSHPPEPPSIQPSGVTAKVIPAGWP